MKFIHTTKNALNTKISSRERNKREKKKKKKEKKVSYERSQTRDECCDGKKGILLDIIRRPRHTTKHAKKDLHGERKRR